ncbi:MAG TPA: DUF1295 domain-containing protein [Microbacteriaceae bacterium]
MYRTRTPSIGAKLVLVGLNALGVAIGAWLLFGGLAVIAGWFGASVPDAALPRRILLVACSFVYLARIIATTFVMVNREVKYGEAIGVGIWIIAIHVTMATLGALNPDAVGIGTAVGIVLYLVGSVLNTASEYLRKRWKTDPAHVGQLYTGGLFRYAVHINYFGDCMLFIGFAFIAGSAWALIIPGLMVCLFVFGNIPMLDKHLAEHHGEPFTDYAKRTAKFVPLVY